MEALFHPALLIVLYEVQSVQQIRYLGRTSLDFVSILIIHSLLQLQKRTRQNASEAGMLIKYWWRSAGETYR